MHVQRKGREEEEAARRSSQQPYECIWASAPHIAQASGGLQAVPHPGLRTPPLLAVAINTGQPLTPLLPPSFPLLAMPRSWWMNTLM